MGADRTLRIAHGWDPRDHGLSLERVPLHVGYESGDAFSDLPPIGVPFVEVVALPDGDVLFVLGARLVDNHVLREGGGRARASVMREVAAALVRAADLADAKSPPPLSAGHQQLAEFAADAVRDSVAVAREGR